MSHNEWGMTALIFLIYSGMIYISPHFIIRGIFIWAMIVLIVGTIGNLTGG